MSASDDLAGNAPKERTQADVLEEIKVLSSQIKQKEEDLLVEGGRTYGAMAEIQSLRRARGTLRGELQPFKLVWEHPNPESLPTPVKMTRNELRRFMGYYGPWDDGEI